MKKVEYFKSDRNEVDQVLCDHLEHESDTDSISLDSNGYEDTDEEMLRRLVSDDAQKIDL